jgi:hypothetical protein
MDLKVTEIQAVIDVLMKSKLTLPLESVSHN